MLWTTLSIFDNLHKMNQFLERHVPLKLSQEETGNLNKPVSVLKKFHQQLLILQNKVVAGPDLFTGDFSQTSKKKY